MTIIKKKFYFIILFFLFIFLIEFISYLSLKFFNFEVFHVGKMFEKTYDERIITIKKNYDNLKVEEEDWRIITSNIGTRISKNEKNLQEFDNKKIPKIIFIGDSVPFGWGVNAESSIPYLFGKKKSNYLSINGAVPAYSLSQSVARFKYEFKKIENIKYVYLQIYEPAVLYGRLGAKWKENDSWYNQRYILPSLRSYDWWNYLIGLRIPFYGKPNLLLFIEKYIIKKRGYEISFHLPSENSDKRYISHIEFQLNELLKDVNSINAKLIIAPITFLPNIEEFKDDLPGHIKDEFPYHVRAVKILNTTLKNFSKYKNIFFIDTISILNLDDNYIENYIDKCCHLSKKGAEKISLNLIKIINQ